MTKVKQTTARARTGPGGLHDAAIVPIDPDLQLDDDEIPVPRRGRPSPWRTQLEALLEMVSSGDVESGKFVRIGEFQSPQGAQHRAVRMAEYEPELADGWRFQYRWKVIDKTRSELWARITKIETEGGAK